MLTHLEDYLEFIAGYRDSTGKLSSWPVSQISLANYDRNVVDSLASQTVSGRGLTDRQLVLAQKIVHKYRRQCLKFGVSVPESPSLRIAIRQIDRSQTVEHDAANNRLLIKFRYQDNLVDDLRKFAVRSCGEVRFDRELMAWTVGLSIPNLMWIWSWAQERKLELRFDPVELSQELEQFQPQYEIDFDPQGQLTVTPEISSIDFSQCQKDPPSLLKSVYHSSCWQLPYSQKVREQFVRQYRDHWLEWTTDKQVHIRPSQYGIGSLATWIQALELETIVWQHQDPEFVERLQEVFGAERVQLLPDKYRKSFVPAGRFTVYYTNKLNTSTVRHLPDISLLITDNSIIYGVKNLFQNRINKLIYYGEQQLVETH